MRYYPEYDSDLVPPDIEKAVRDAMPTLIALDEALCNHNMPYPGTKLTIYLGGHYCTIEGERRKTVYTQSPSFHLGRTA